MQPAWRELAWQAATIPVAFATWALALLVVGRDAPYGISDGRLLLALLVVGLGASAGPRHALPAIAMPAACFALLRVWPFHRCPPPSMCEGAGLPVVELLFLGIGAAWLGCLIGALGHWARRRLRAAPNP